MRYLPLCLIIPFLAVLLAGCGMGSSETTEEKVRDDLLYLKRYGDERLIMACDGHGVDIRKFNRPPVFAQPCCGAYFDPDVLYCAEGYHFFISSWRRIESLYRVKPGTPCKIDSYGTYEGHAITDIETGAKYFGKFEGLYDPF